jgi:hypothetical protein
MKKRTLEEWQALFKAQAASGLNQAQFCKEQGLCAKHYSLRKRQWLTETSKPFVRVQRPGACATPVVELQAQVGEVVWRVRGLSREQMLTFMKGLA